jgi:hypothetical protein
MDAVHLVIHATDGIDDDLGLIQVNHVVEAATPSR